MTTVFDFTPTFPFLRRNLRRAQKLAREGRLTTGQVVGLKVRPGTDSSPDRYEWALLVEGARLGVRQRLPHGASESVRFQQVLPVRVDGRGGAIIVLADSLSASEFDFKVVDPPADGIDDAERDLTQERRKAGPAQITVRSARRTTAFGMAMQTSTST